MNQKFNPGDWLPNNQPEIELVVSRIELARTDITGTYSDWLNIGFALADELAESGRDYFHRISRFYIKYSYKECNNQYDQCIKSQGHGITIKTLFHLAKMSGIDITGLGAGSSKFQVPGSKFQVPGSTPESSGPPAPSSTPQANGSEPHAPSSTPQVVLPTFPESIYETLPEFLQRVVARSGTNEERDILLLGALATLSACLPKVFGIYDEVIVYANLYLFITSPASAGKGRLINCKRLVNPIHWSRRKLSNSMKAQYELEIREYNLQKAKGLNIDKPLKPAEKMLIIPANNSSAGVFQLLAGNDGYGLIFETEVKTMIQALKSEHGDYSDCLCKGYHHEAVTIYRKTNQEYEEIESPCISLVLSGTPKQVARLIPSAEDGLFSRFIFYYMNIRQVWKNVFPATKSVNLNVYFDQLGQEFYPLYLALLDKPEIEFSLSDVQKEQFHVFFTKEQEKYTMLLGMDYIATIRRLGIISFRIAMIFTILRILETGDYSQKKVCSDTDFQASLSMVKVLLRHASHVYSQLPEELSVAKPRNKQEQFLEMLPEKFNHQEFIDLAKILSIPQRTAALYISNFCDKRLVVRDQRGVYTNLNYSGNKDEKMQ